MQVANPIVAIVTISLLLNFSVAIPAIKLKTTSGKLKYKPLTSANYAVVVIICVIVYLGSLEG